MQRARVSSISAACELRRGRECLGGEPSQGRRGHSQDTVDELVELLEIGDADMGGDGLDGEAGVLEEIAGPIHAAAGDVGGDGCAGGGAEKAGQVIVGEVEFAGEVGDVNGAGKTEFDQFQCPADGRVAQAGDGVEWRGAIVAGGGGGGGIA